MSVRPFLRWAGSKRKLVPELSSYWSGSYDRYLEPFMGSACLFFAVEPSRAVLSDINQDLVEAFEWVCDAPEEVHQRLSQIPRTEHRYYKVRDKTPSLMKPVNRAVRFIYLNRNCFNGLYRTNSDGEFNVPFSSSRVGDYPTMDEFIEAARVLEGAEIISGDFEEVLRKRVKNRDFVYLDPPYAVENRRVFKQYGPQVFGQADIERLSNVLDEIDERGAHFVLSYAKCPTALDAFSKWKYRQVETQRNISGFAKHRRKDSELIITNIK